MAAEPQAVLTSGRCPMPAGEPPQTRLRKEASPPRAASSRRGEVRAGLSPQQGLLPGQLSSSGRGVGLRASSLDGQPVLPLRATPHGGQDPGPWVSCKCPSPTLHMPQSPLRGTQADRQGSTWPGHGASRARTAGRGGGYPLREQISKLSPQHVGWRREPHSNGGWKAAHPRAALPSSHRGGECGLLSRSCPPPRFVQSPGIRGPSGISESDRLGGRSKKKAGGPFIWTFRCASSNIKR